eukprot:1200330-Alexandrium_andersonii.AAC.1
MGQSVLAECERVGDRTEHAVGPGEVLHDRIVLDLIGHPLPALVLEGFAHPTCASIVVDAVDVAGHRL